MTPTLPGDILQKFTGRDIAEVTSWARSLPERFFDKDGHLRIHPVASQYRLDRENFISSLMRFLYDFVRHDEHGNIVYYKLHLDSDYEALSDQVLVKMVTRWFDTVFKSSPDSEVRSTCKNILNHVEKTANVRNRVIKIFDGAYYDANKGDIVDEYKDGCFCQLVGPNTAADRSGHDNGREYLKGIAKQSFYEMSEILDSKISEGYTQFGQFYRELPINYEFIKEWANERVPEWKDRYWDIMTMYSTMFFRKLPKRIYDLNGKGRCAKSTALDLLSFEWGVLAASVRISDFANRDVNNELAYCFINIPDEEKVSGVLSSDACANFKTLSTHKGLFVGVKNKGPVWVDGQFMMVIAGNGAPKWPPKESEPCMQRIIFIKFTNFFGTNDTTDFDFIEDVILKNPEMYARFIGERLALARFFSVKGRQMFISNDAKSVNEYLSVDDNSISLYHRLWNKYYDGVSNLNFHYDDYRYCCEAFGWVIQSREEFRQTEIELHANKPTPIRLENGKSVRCVRVPKYKPARILHPKLYIPEHGTAESLHSLGQSVVAVFAKAEEEAKMQEMEKKMETQEDMIKLLGKKGTKALLGDNYIEEEDE